MSQGSVNSSSSIINECDTSSFISKHSDMQGSPFFIATAESKHNAALLCTCGGVVGEELLSCHYCSCMGAAYSPSAPQGRAALVFRDGPGEWFLHCLKLSSCPSSSHYAQNQPEDLGRVTKVILRDTPHILEQGCQTYGGGYWAWPSAVKIYQNVAHHHQGVWHPCIRDSFYIESLYLWEGLLISPQPSIATLEPGCFFFSV